MPTGVPQRAVDSGVGFGEQSLEAAVEARRCLATIACCLDRDERIRPAAEHDVLKLLHHGTIRGNGLEATAAAAGRAQWAGRVVSDVAELAGKSARAGHQVALVDDASTDAG